MVEEGEDELFPILFSLLYRRPFSMPFPLNFRPKSFLIGVHDPLERFTPLVTLDQPASIPQIFLLSQVVRSQLPSEDIR